MPKKIRSPNATVTLTFDPSYLRIQHSLDRWVVRARQTSALGNAWIVIASVTTEREALLIADCLAEPGRFATDGTNFTRKENR